MKSSLFRHAPKGIAAGLLVLAMPLSAFASSFNGILPLTTSGSMPAPLAAPAITMSNYDLIAGQTATVTFTFPAAPLSFISSDISATNGTISNLATTSNPDVFTATFTPSADTRANTNAISVKGKVIGATFKDASFNQPYGIAFDGTNMWVTNTNSTTVSKLAPNGSVIAVATGFDGPAGIAFDGTNMWVTNYGASGGAGSGNGHTVRELSVASSSIIGSPVTVGQAPNAIAFDGSNMWTANYVDGTSPGSVTEIASTSVVLLTATTSPGTYGIAFDGTNMWTTNFGSNNDGSGHSVTKISPTGTSTTYTGTGGGPTGIAFDGTNMWTANYGSFRYAGPDFTDFEFNNDGNSVTKVAPSGALTTYIGTGPAPAGIAYDGTNMWVTNYSTFNDTEGGVTEVAPDGTMTTYTGVGLNPTGIAFDGTNMWTANDNNDSVPGGDSVSKITGTISPGTSANYIVETIPEPASSSGSSGGSVTSQVQNLMAMGNTKAAQALETQWPNLFSSSATSSVATSSTATATTTLPVTTSSIATVFTRYLQRGMTGNDVQALQRYLNSQGFTVAATGPGSPGQESTHFGMLTFDALVAFQQAHAADILAPFHLTQGTGVLGPVTIKYINSGPR